MAKKFRSIIAYILTTVLIICAVPSAAYADTTVDSVLMDKTDGFVAGDFVHASTVTVGMSVAGKSAADESVLVKGTSDNFYFNSGSVTIDKSKIYVYEISIAPKANFEQIYVATKSHSSMSSKVDSSMLLSGCWNKIQFVYQPSAGVSHMYVNGEDVGEYQISDTSLSYVNDSANGLRFVFIPTKTNNANNEMAVYVDDVKLYTSDTYVRDYTVRITNADYALHYADNETGMFYVGQSSTVAQLKSYLSDNGGFAHILKNGVAVSDSVLVQGDYTVVVTDAHNVSRAYTTAIWQNNTIIAEGSATEPNGRFSSGDFHVRARCSAGDMLIIAQYTSLGQLLCVSQSSEVQNKRIEATISVSETDGSKIKVYLWCGNSLRPKASVAEYRYIVDDIYSVVKTDGYAPKPEATVFMDETFDEYSDSALGNGWMILSSGEGVAVSDDTWNSGKYLSIKGGSASLKRFFEPNGGNARFDMQLVTFDESGEAAFKMFGYNHSSEDKNLISYFKVSACKLYAVDVNGSSDYVCDIEADEWYNISLYYNADKCAYDIYVDGVCMLEGLAYHTTVRTFECIDISSSSGDFGIDNIRMSHMLAGETAVTGFDVNSDIIYVNNFDKYTQKELITQDVAGSIYYDNEDGNGYLLAERTAASGTCSSLFSFPNVTDDVTFEFDVYLEDDGSGTKLISLLGGIGCTIYFSGQKLIVYGPTNDTRLTVKSDVSIGQWHSVKMVTDIVSSTYELYFDGECLAIDAPMQSNNSANVNKFRFSITSGKPTSYRMDNVAVTRNHTYNGAAYDIDVFSPDENAPASYEWQSNYISAPTGLVYEAEDMQLSNFLTVSDSSYSDGSYVETAGNGCGVAQFEFDGEDGYYAINVGYGEIEGTYDCFYNLCSNGKRIDWWIGQFDDGMAHVRNAKSYHYVNSGDIFSIVGAGGMDAARLDYVEFVPVSELSEFTHGDLIDDDDYHPSYWLTSGWDAAEKGGYVRNGKIVYDCRTDANCELIRNVYPFYKPFVLDYTLKINNSHDCYMKIGDGDVFPVWYKFGGKAITTSDGTKFSNVYANTSTLKYRIIVDTINKSYTLIVNGSPLAENIPFDEDVEKFTQIRFETSDSGTSHFSLTTVKLTAGYNLFESFRPYVSGTAPYGWQLISATSQTMLSEGSDSQSLRIGSGGTAKYTFDKINGKITYETYFILPTAKDGATMQLGSGSSYIGFYTKDGNIYYDTNSGEDGVLRERYKSNIWYTLRIELDTDANKATFYVNDFQKAEDIPVSLDGVDNVYFVSGSDSGYLWVDDISVVDSIYETTVPKPDIPQQLGDYTIVMECCDLWREGNHFGWDSLAPFDNRLPLLGYLEDGNPEVADWETKFMAEHGITTYVPCWYTNTNASNSPVKEPRNAAKLNNGFLKSEYSQYLDFAILITTVPSDITLDSFAEHYVNYWIERYFKAPNYWKIDNKPVIPIYCVSNFNSISGSDTSLILERIDEVLIQNGFDGGVYLGTLNSSVTAANGYDYKYQYHQGSKPDGISVITSLLEKQSSDGVGLLASPSQGWGNEAWGRADRKYNVPLDEWYGSLKWIRDYYFPSQDIGSLTAKTLWLGNWNEYSEGHSLAPSRIAGFGYLDGVRKVFTYGSDAHQDALPQEAYDYMTAILWD